MKLYLFRMLDGSSYISGLKLGRKNEQRQRMKDKSKCEGSTEVGIFSKYIILN